MAFQVLRVQKLKSMISIRRSLKHSYREQDTPNADPDLLAENQLFGATNTKQVMAKMKELFPDKLRKNGVLCVEHLITASPDWFEGQSKKGQNKYFTDSVKFLKTKWGADNVVAGGIHRDEKTPHMFVYVVPKDPDTGKLNCRRWLGEKNALSNMQTLFHEEVSSKYGLERGLKGSKAKHKTLKKYYEEQRLIEKSVGKDLEISKKELLKAVVTGNNSKLDNIIKLAKLAPKAKAYAINSRDKMNTAIQSAEDAMKVAENHSQELINAKAKYDPAKEKEYYAKVQKAKKLIDDNEKEKNEFTRLKKELEETKEREAALERELDTEKNRYKFTENHEMKPK